MDETRPLKEEELKQVNGGQVIYPDSAGYSVTVDGHVLNVVDDDWGGPCHAFGHEPDYWAGDWQPHWCKYCREYRELKEIGLDRINGWRGFCTWEG